VYDYHYFSTRRLRRVIEILENIVPYVIEQRSSIEDLPSPVSM